MLVRVPTKALFALILVLSILHTCHFKFVLCVGFLGLFGGIPAQHLVTISDDQAPTVKQTMVNHAMGWSRRLLFTLPG